MGGGFGIMAAAGVSGHSEAGEEEAEASAVFCAVNRLCCAAGPVPAVLRSTVRPCLLRDWSSCRPPAADLVPSR